MASAWGSSWGKAWGNAWGSIDTATTSGGWESWKHVRAGKTKQEIKEERTRLGITEPEAKVIDNVVEGLLSDHYSAAQDQDRKDELKYHLKLQTIRYETRHLEAMNHQYRLLLNQEITLRLEQAREDEDISILLLTI